MKRLVIAAPASGSGKTTLTLVVIAGWAARGEVVQPFKVGPDYIDGSLHAVVAGRPVRNLDLWMGGPEDVRRQFGRGMQGADVGVVEGVMGLYDSGAPDNAPNSTADVATALNAPIILVVDASKMAESVAAMVHGFHTVRRDVRLAGVVLNRVAGPRHFDLLAPAIRQSTGVPVLGYLPAEDSWTMPERHLGLVPASEQQDLRRRAAEWAARARATLDWDALDRVADSAPDFPPLDSPSPLPVGRVPVALARDPAFHFYYTANLEILEDLGAEIIPFSPLHGDPIPSEARLLYAGGGFPEEFLPVFRELAPVHAEYRRRIEEGLPVLAECGGYLWLGRSLAGRDGDPVSMVGVVPADHALGDRLQGFGYRTIRAQEANRLLAGSAFRGHEFHYSRPVSAPPAPPAWRLIGRRGEADDGYATPHVTAGFAHLYLPSNLAAVRRLLANLASA